jgi:hypothetical protein
MISYNEIEILVHHYTVEANRWRDESPTMLREAEAGLKYWTEQRNERKAA